MTTPDHRAWTDRLSDYMAGDLDPAKRARLEEHLAGCAHCREVLADLREVVALARGAEDLEPPSDLWPALAASMRAAESGRSGADEGVIALPTARSGLVTPGVSGPRLAAAAAVLVLLSVGSTWWVATSGVVGAESEGEAATMPSAEILPAGSIPEDLAVQLGALEDVLAATRASLDPATVEILERNLRTIEVAIDDSAEALAADPGNAFLLEHLRRMYRRKLTYLQDAVRVAEWAG